jgi:hypothetical protein
MDYLGDGGADSPLFEHHSPIYVQQVRPLGTGKGLLELTFFHANYSEGVQGKRYRLRTLKRAGRHLIAERADGSPDAPKPSLVFYDLSDQWMRAHFPHVIREARPGESVADCLTRRFGPAL